MEGHNKTAAQEPHRSRNSGSSSLPTALQLHVLSLLPPNDRALSGRFACRDAADALSGPQHCTASLSQPLPPHAAPWAQEAGKQHVRQLPFRHKFQLLSTAARSGSEANLEVAWALLEPSVFPELLQNEQDRYNPYPDPGVATVRAGHVHLLGWLLRRCPGLVQPDKVLEAAALHRPLAELQQAWETLRDHINSGNMSSTSRSSSLNGSRRGRVHLLQVVLNAAAQSLTPDALGKMEWLLAGAGSCRLQPTTAAAAACSGDLGRLRWLRDRGCPFSQYTLPAVLEQASLPVAQRLVGEGVHELPPRAGEGEDSSSWSWKALMHAAARSSNGVAKLRWLQEQGAPSLTGVGARLAQDLALVAVGAGQVEVVQYLVSAVRPAALIQDPYDQNRFGEAATKSGSTQMVEYLVQEAGWALSHRAYEWAAEVGGLAMIRWLALEAGVSAAGCNLGPMVAQWPCSTQADSRDLLEAVQLLVGAGCWETYAKRDAIAVAARRGDLALVQYLHRWLPGRLSVGQYQWAEAVSGGCEALLEWMAQQPGWRDKMVSSYRGPVSIGDKGTVAALRRLGVPWCHQNLLVCAVVYWGCELPVLRWLAEQSAPVGDRGELQEAVEAAVQRRGLVGDKAAELRSWAAGV